MIRLLKEYIDTKAFVKSVNDRLLHNDCLIIDSFISNNCNLKCKHCYFGDINPVSDAVSFEIWENFITEAIDSSVRHFHFSGKEPFLDNRIFPILDLLSKNKDRNNLFYGTVSNGTSLDSKKCNEILETNISYFEVSVEGTKNYNDTIRGAGKYDIVYELISKIDHKDKINTTSTIFENNHSELISMMNAFRKIGVYKFNFAPILYYSSSQLAPYKTLSYQSILNFISKCQDYIDKDKDSKSIDIRICLTKQMAYDLFTNENLLTPQIEKCVFEGEKMKFQKENKIIEFNFPLLNIPFLNGLVITHDGYVIPCADDIHYNNIQELALPKINIKKNSFQEILRSRNKFINKYLQANLV